MKVGAEAAETIGWCVGDGGGTETALPAMCASSLASLDEDGLELDERCCTMSSPAATVDQIRRAEQLQGKRKRWEYPEAALAGAGVAEDAVDPEYVAAGVHLHVVALGRRADPNLREVEPAALASSQARPPESERGNRTLQ